MKYIKTAFVLGFLAMAPSLWAWDGRVERVVDGDSPVVNGRELRLYGIDSPEHDQPHYRESKHMLEHLLVNRMVHFDQFGTDPRGRPVVVATVDGLSVNAEMLRIGGAWWSRKYCKASFCDDWKRLAREARRKHQGLWAEENPMPPWDWRRSNRPWEQKSSCPAPGAGHR